MPGSSLWLIPPPSSALNEALQILISTTIPSHFPSTKTHPFIPHITLTSNIPADIHSPDAQKWLDSLPLPSASMVARIEVPEAGKPFFKKLTLRMGRDEALIELATSCRASGVLNGDERQAKGWAREEYLPHLSLMYADLDAKHVEANLTAVDKALSQTSSKLVAGSKGKLCQGGYVVLVPTDKPIQEWAPIARRGLPELEWTWS